MRILLGLLLAGLTLAEGVSQTLTTNEDGEQIIVYPDGSWRYFAEARSEGDSLLTFQVEEPGPETYSNTQLSAEAEAQSRALFRRRLKPYGKEITRQERELDDLKRNDRKLAQRLQKLRASVREQDQAKAAEVQAELSATRRQASQIESALGLLEAELAILEQAVTMSSRRRQTYLAQQGLLVVQEPGAGLARQQAQAASRERAAADAVLAVTPNPNGDSEATSPITSTAQNDSEQAATLDFELAPQDTDLNADLNADDAAPKADNSIEPLDANSDAVSQSADATHEQGGFASVDDFALSPTRIADSSAPVAQVDYDPAQDPTRQMPQRNCREVERSKDEFTGKLKVRLEPELLLAHTSEQLRRVMRDGPLLTARCNAMRNGGFLFLEVDFVIRSQFANQEFGILPKGSQLVLRDLEGDAVTLRNATASQGSYDPIDQVYRYRGLYPISSKQERILRKRYLNEVSVMWSAGFEVYEVYDIDLLQRQLDCL